MLSMSAVALAAAAAAAAAAVSVVVLRVAADGTAARVLPRVPAAEGRYDTQLLAIPFPLSLFLFLLLFWVLFA